MALKKMTAAKKAAGKKARAASAKKNTAAMKKKGIGIFAPKTLSPALAGICGGKTMPRTEVTKKIWVYIKKNSLNQGRTIKPDAKLKAIFPVASLDMLKMAGYVCALASLDHHDEDDDQGHGQDHEDDGYEGDQGGAQGDEEGRWQDREEGRWQKECACHEEEGCRHFRAEEAQRCFGGHLRGQDHAAYRGDEEDLGLHQEELAQPGSHHQAGCEVEGHLPGCEHRHAEDGWVREPLVLRPWGIPGHLAEDFRRRAGLSSRGLLSRARLFLEWLLLLPDFNLKSSVGALACP